MKKQRVLDLLMKYEQGHALVDRKLLYQTICSSEQMTFIIFSCLATEKDREELTLDFFQTSFFYGGKKTLSSSVRKTIDLMMEIETLGINSQVVPVLVDTEPIRTWGWNTDQEELTISCQLMVEQAVDSLLLPKNWQPTIWSAIEAHYIGVKDFEKCLKIVRGLGKQQLFIGQQEKCLERFADRYHFPLSLKETATRQVAAYAWEGLVLEQVYPNAVLLQSEGPWKHKDPLYQWLRNKTLPIIHPFKY